MEHVYDFYKPDLRTEYPIVDGHFSIVCYTRALDKCYQYYNAKYEKHAKQTNGVNGTHKEPSGIDRFAYFAFHSPTCKLVQKSYARLLYNDYLSNTLAEEFAFLDDSITSIDYQKSLTDKGVEKAFMGLSKKIFVERVYPGTLAARLVGNMYTASVYSSLASIVTEIPGEKLKGRRIGLFSYGGGSAASLFSVKVVGDVSDMAKNMNLNQILDQRVKIDPAAYVEVRSLRNLLTVDIKTP
jgi:hydroxymethylglutaryl-CoA synthase